MNILFGFRIKLPLLIITISLPPSPSPPHTHTLTHLHVIIDCHCQRRRTRPSVVCFAKCIPPFSQSKNLLSLRGEGVGGGKERRRRTGQEKKGEKEKKEEKEDEKEEEKKEEEEGVSALHETGCMSWEGGRGAFGCRVDMWLWHPAEGMRRQPTNQAPQLQYSATTMLRKYF